MSYVSMPRFYAVRRCIYCDAQSTLTTEHVIPKALGGTLQLPEASCAACAATTSGFEGRCAALMAGFRARAVPPHKKGRAKKRRTANIPMLDPDGKDVGVPIADAVVPLPVLRYPLAGMLRRPIDPRPDWSSEGVGLHVLWHRTDATRPAPANVRPMLRVDAEVTDAYARMLAKIAHTFAVGMFGFHAFEHMLPRYILGSETALSHVVGGASGQPPFVPDGQAHQLAWSLREIGHDQYVTVVVRLFAGFFLPTDERPTGTESVLTGPGLRLEPRSAEVEAARDGNEVVVGRADPELVRAALARNERRFARHEVIVSPGSVG